MNSVPGHIVILCSRLDLPGGTERAIVNTANLFASKGNKVTLLIVDETDQSFFPISNLVSVHSLRLHFGITESGNTITRKIDFIRHLRVLKKKISELSPDVIITSEYPFTIAAGLLFKNSNIRIYSWEHHHFHWIKRNWFWDFLHKKIYPQITAVVSLNKTEQQLFVNYGCKAVVIPNFVIAQTRASLNNAVLLSVGWLNWRKGVDLIPLIAENVFQKYADWSWMIIGCGEKEDELKALLAEKKLSEKIKIIHPVSADISEAYKNASIYVMTSRFECFPMVLLEAMSFGLPCIAFNCPTGPADIIHKDIDGMLIEKENIEAMVTGISKLIEEEETRKKMGACGFENSKRFSPETVYRLWEKLFSSPNEHL